MKIKYKITLDAKIAFSNYHCSKSASEINSYKDMIKRTRKCYLFYAILIFIIIIQMAYVVNSLFVFCVAITILGLSIASLRQYNPSHSELYDENIKAYYTEKPYYKNDFVIDLELADSELISESKESKILHNLNSVGEICNEPDYVFIYFGSPSALLIPKNSIIEGDLDIFMNKLEEKIERGFI